MGYFSGCERFISLTNGVANAEKTSGESHLMKNTEHIHRLTLFSTLLHVKLVILPRLKWTTVWPPVMR